MKIGELMRLLGEVSEEHGPDTEVRLAMQPTWPFEYSIGGVSTLSQVSSDIEDLEEVRRVSPPEEWPDGLEQELQRLREMPRVVWLVEGRQLGYTSSEHWHQ